MSCCSFRYNFANLYHHFILSLKRKAVVLVEDNLICSFFFKSETNMIIVWKEALDGDFEVCLYAIFYSCKSSVGLQPV